MPTFSIKYSHNHLNKFTFISVNLRGTRKTLLHLPIFINFGKIVKAKNYNFLSVFILNSLTRKHFFLPHQKPSINLSNSRKISGIDSYQNAIKMKDKKLSMSFKSIQNTYLNLLQSFIKLNFGEKLRMLIKIVLKNQTFLLLTTCKKWNYNEQL